LPSIPQGWHLGVLARIGKWRATCPDLPKGQRGECRANGKRVTLS
jgi:hypothetical protein